MLDPQPPLVELLVRPLLLQGQLRTAGPLRRHEDLHLRERERQETQILQQPTPSREWVGGGLSDAQIMDTAAVGVAQKQDGGRVERTPPVFRCALYSPLLPPFGPGSV